MATRNLSGHIQQMALAEVRETNVYQDGKYRTGNIEVINSLQIAPSFGPIWYTGLDLGTPSVDAVLTPYSNRSGSFDETRYHRERAISLDLTVIDDWFPDVGAENWRSEENNSAYWVAELGHWVVPYGRFRLYWRYTGSDNATYWTDVRGAGMSQGIDKSSREYRDVQLNFVSPSGRVYRFDESYDPSIPSENQTATIDGRTRFVRALAGVGGTGTPGITFNIKSLNVADPNAPMVDFQTTGAPIASAGPGIFYRGTIDTGVRLRIRSDPGIATVDPKIVITHYPTNQTSTVGFSGLTIPAGQFVEVDTSKMSVFINGITSDSQFRADSLLTPPLQWPQLRTGLNLMTYTAGSAGPLSTVEAVYFEAYVA